MVPGVPSGLMTWRDPDDREHPRRRNPQRPRLQTPNPRRHNRQHQHPNETPTQKPPHQETHNQEKLMPGTITSLQSLPRTISWIKAWCRLHALGTATDLSLHSYIVIGTLTNRAVSLFSAHHSRHLLALFGVKSDSGGEITIIARLLTRSFSRSANSFAYSFP